jgi:hypothetical protein
VSFVLEPWISCFGTLDFESLHPQKKTEAKDRWAVVALIHQQFHSIGFSIGFHWLHQWAMAWLVHMEIAPEQTVVCTP